jgi:hypothetical protein
MNRQHEVTAAYLANKHIGVRGVGHKLGIPHQRVSQILKRSAVDVKAIRKQQTRAIRDKMCAFYGLGWTPKQIAAEMGYSAIYVRQVVRGDLG